MFTASLCRLRKTLKFFLNLKLNLIAWVGKNPTLFYLLLNIYFFIFNFQFFIAVSLGGFLVFKYFVVLFLLFLVVFLFDLKFSTQLYILAVFNVLVIPKHLFAPFFNTMPGDIFSVDFLLLIVFVLLKKSYKYIYFLMLAFFLTFFVFIARSLILTISDGCGFCLFVFCFILYLLTLLGILITRVYFPKLFKSFCFKVEQYCVFPNFQFSLLCATFVFMIQFQYSFLMFCSEILASFGLIEILPGTPNPHTYIRCGWALDKWCRMYATQTTFCAVNVRPPASYVYNSFKDYLKAGANLSDSVSIASNPKVQTYGDLIKYSPLTHPLLEITKTDTVTGDVERTVHAVTHGTPQQLPNQLDDRVKITIPYAIDPDPQYIMNQGYKVSDSFRKILQPITGSSMKDRSMQQVQNKLTTDPVEAQLVQKDHFVTKTTSDDLIQEIRQAACKQNKNF